MNRRDFIKTALLSSPAVWMASKYGLPCGGKFESSSFEIHVTEPFFISGMKYMSAHSSGAPLELFKVLDVISPTKALVKVVEE